MVPIVEAGKIYWWKGRERVEAIQQRGIVRLMEIWEARFPDGKIRRVTDCALHNLPEAATWDYKTIDEMLEDIRR